MQPVTQAESRIARIFRARDWVALTPAFLRIMTFVGERVDFVEGCINRDLRQGRLHAALVAPDGTIKHFEGPDWQQRTVRSPLRPAEGVRVEPYEEGRWFIWRADLDREYPTNPVTPATAADRQLSPISKLDAWVAEHGPALTGGRPKEGWTKFYDRCRDDCDGWTDKKNGKPAADFSNKTIERRLQHAGFKPKPDK
jgi:hypothetical protein